MGVSISLTEQLQRFSAGERQLGDAILREIWPILRQIAVRRLREEKYREPMCPTELIHEVWLRNLHKGRWKIQNRQHFYSIVGIAMQEVLCDFARRRLAQRRGEGEAPVSLDVISESEVSDVARAQQIIEIGILADQLERVDPQAADMFRLVYWTGCTLEEGASMAGIKFYDARMRWERGREWFKAQYSGSRAPSRRRWFPQMSLRSWAGLRGGTPAPRS
jgi:RNA polymerase sigma factor (TIGR02999 family)